MSLQKKKISQHKLLGVESNMYLVGQIVLLQIDLQNIDLTLLTQPHTEYAYSSLSNSSTSAFSIKYPAVAKSVLVFFVWIMPFIYTGE